MNAYHLTGPASTRFANVRLRVVTYKPQGYHLWKLVLQVAGVPEDPLVTDWGTELEILNWLSQAQREGWTVEPEYLQEAV